MIQDGSSLSSLLKISFKCLNIIIRFLENNDLKDPLGNQAWPPQLTTNDHLCDFFPYVLTKKVTFDLHVLYSVWHLPIPRLHTKSVPLIVTLIVLLVNTFLLNLSSKINWKIRPYNFSIESIYRFDFELQLLILILIINLDFLLNKKHSMDQVFFTTF